MNFIAEKAIHPDVRMGHVDLKVVVLGSRSRGLALPLTSISVRHPQEEWLRVADGSVARMMARTPSLNASRRFFSIGAA